MGSRPSIRTSNIKSKIFLSFLDPNNKKSNKNRVHVNVPQTLWQYVFQWKQILWDKQHPLFQFSIALFHFSSQSQQYRFCFHSSQRQQPCQKVEFLEKFIFIYSKCIKYWHLITQMAKAECLFNPTSLGLTKWFEV